MANSPAWKPNTDPVVPKLKAAGKLAVTWQMAFLYAVCFGGFVAFYTYLPTYLKTIYDFSLTDAGARTAGFAIAAVIARPIGGVLSDRLHPKIVVMIALAGAAVMAVVVALQPPAGNRRRVRVSSRWRSSSASAPAGCSPGWPAPRRPNRVGSVTGIVGAAGGLGGYFPPLIMGATYDSVGQQLHRRPRPALAHLPARPAVHGLAVAGPIGNTPVADARRTAAVDPPPGRRLDERAPRDRRRRSPTCCCAAGGSSPAARCPATCGRSASRAAGRVTCSTGTGGATTRWCGPPTG